MIRQAIGRGGVSCRMQSQRVAIPKMMRAKTRCSSFVNHQHESIKTVLPGNASAMSTNVDVVRIPGYLTGNGLEYKENITHYMVKACPLCTKGGFDKLDNQYKLYVEKETGAYFCHRCGEGGSWNSFLQTISDEPTTKSKETKSKSLIANLDDVILAAKQLHGNPEYKAVRDYLIQQRGISYDVLCDYFVGACDWRFRSDGDEFEPHQSFVFPSISLSNNKVRFHRAKIRSLLSKSCMSLTPGSWGLFGSHLVSPDLKEIILTEGEFDAMAIREGTGLPAISLPNGSHSFPKELVPFFNQFERIYIWMDEDESGQKGEEKLIKLFGKANTRIIKPSSLGYECKDANEALLRGFPMWDFIRNAKSRPHSSLISAGSLLETMRAEQKDYSRKVTPYTALPTLQKLTKGFRPGELTIVTGPTGSGKTTLLSQLSIDTCTQGIKTLWGSFEIKNTQLLSTMCHQLAGRTQDVAIDQIPLYFLNYFGSTDTEKVLDAMAYAVSVQRVQHIVLDNLQFMMGDEAHKGFERFDFQDKMIGKFRRFATDHDVHVSLVIHPRKEPYGQALSLSSVFGSAKATQEADNVFIVQTVAEGKYLDVRKNRYDGAIGSVQINFDTQSKNFIEQGSELPLLKVPALSMEKKKDELPQKEVPVATDLGAALQDITQSLLQYDVRHSNRRNNQRPAEPKNEDGFWEQTIIEH